MRIDRDAAAVVANGNPVARGKLDLDSRSMAGDGLVHGVVEYFSGEVMEPAFVGTTDIHAGAAAHRLQPLEHLDILCRVAVGSSRDRCIEEIWHGANIRMVKVGASSIQCRWKANGTTSCIDWETAPGTR